MTFKNAILSFTTLSLTLVGCAQVNETQIVEATAVNSSNGLENTSEVVPKKITPKATLKNSQSELVWPSETEDELAKHAATETLDIQRPIVQAFIQKMVVEHGFTSQYITETLQKGKNQEWILKLIAKPAEKSKEWYEYRQIFLNEKRITLGKEFMQEHKNSLTSANEKYGVAPELITSIIGVETQYGANYGKTKVLDALVTLGFNYPPRRKLFINQLEEMFLLCREQGFDANTLIGSYAGAMGNGQFIPSSYRDFAVDGDGDGIVDLWESWPDTIHSVANYFKMHKWKDGEEVLSIASTELGCDMKFPESKVGLDAHTVGSLRNGNCPYIFETTLPDEAPAMFLTMQQEQSTDILIGFNNFYSITRYNRSPKYARAVHELSQEFTR